MSTTPLILLSDDVTPAVDLTVTPNPLPSSTVSDEGTVHIWAQDEDTGDFDLVPQAKSGAVWYTSGIPFIDQAWLEVKLTGEVSGGAVARVTDWTPVTSLSSLPVPSIPAGGMRVAKYRVRARPIGVLSRTYQFKLTPQTNPLFRPLEHALTFGPHGVYRRLGDLTATLWVDRPTLEESGTPDAFLNFGWRRLMALGIPFWLPPGTVELDQDAADGPLGSGEEYTALIYQLWSGGDLLAAKSDAAATGASDPPDLPASAEEVGWVLVPYDAGGSEIIAANIHVTAKSDRGAWSSDGLDFTVSPLRARNQTATFAPRASMTTTLPDDDDTWVWLTSSGLVQTTTAVPATAGDIPLYQVTTAAGAVTVVVDRRPWADATTTLRLFYNGAAATSALASLSLAENLTVDSVVFNIQTPSGGTGQTLLDVVRIRAGVEASLFTNGGGSTESRPVIAAGGRTSTNAMPEVTTLRTGDWLEMRGVEITSDASEVGIEVLVICGPCPRT